ncbi:AAA family ATPase [Mycolicibacterium sp. 050158]|uniref:AAA family ATPase n=1 Tax=Mycolicibacterium sp. 050158 TaxID=3090602 RepID=UPI00299DF391|nr:AAA family ATPase [Mycolicibacterium sp. 050158]MDX1893012.1 AAA family ATPase [Mycolicibacterium sp. 050158]
MKLHRLVLRNYRGIAFRDIEFPERGVVVVSGANEIGKSSMIEALDLLMEAKDRSTKKEVKQVKPTHADEGAEITAVISSGPYRFEYFKRFHKKPETRLVVLAPGREQLTGDEAHDRVQAILAETVDTDLWRAQRVLQSASTASVDLSGCDALARALDVAAGQADTLSGAEPLLVDRIDAEFRQYFTATGRPTGQWAAAVARLRETEQRVASCQAAVDEVDEAVVRHGALTGELARLAGERAAAVARLKVAQTGADAVKRLEERLAQARALVEPAEMARAASDAAVAERRRLRADLAERGVAITALEAAVQTAAVEQATAAEVATAASEAADCARLAAEDCQARVEAARATLDRVARRDEVTRLTVRLVKIDAVEGQLVDVEAELAQITMTDEVMRDVELAALATERAAAKAELASALVAFEAVAPVEALVDGQRIQLTPGEPWSQHVTTATEIEVPGVLTVRVVPGAPAADSQDQLDRARQMLAELLAEAGVDDVAAARALDARRRELSASRDRLHATLDALVGDERIGALRARLIDLESASAADPGEDADADAARAELAGATDDHRRARAERDALREAATRAGARATELAGTVTVLQAKLGAARDEVAAATERLVQQRDSTSDDELGIQAEAAAERARTVMAQVLAIEAELEAAGPTAVAAELTEARRLAEAVGERHDEIGGQLREVTAQLRVYGSEGRQGRLDEARTEYEHAAAEHDRVQRRAGAVELLQTVMARHRDQSRLRYVDPFRAEVQRLGRIVFGTDFEVEIDGDLRILNRTLHGCTVPFESLSGGAKEQLGIVARLASAALVAKEDGVPVVIDDALGFSDPDRLARMGEVFDAVGGDGQVIVLTCSPDRYAGIADARHLALRG